MKKLLAVFGIMMLSAKIQAAEQDFIRRPNRMPEMRAAFQAAQQARAASFAVKRRKILNQCAQDLIDQRQAQARIEVAGARSLAFGWKPQGQNSVHAAMRGLPPAICDIVSGFSVPAKSAYQEVQK